MAEKETNTTNTQEIALREGLTEKGESLLSVYIRRFKKHTLGKVGFVILLILYTVALLADFFSPYSMAWADKKKSYHPPSRISLLYTNNEGKTSFRPFTSELIIANRAFKTYGRIPQYSMRAISQEIIPNSLEMRSISISKNPVERETQLVRDIQNHYGLPDGHEAIERVRSEIRKLERDPRLDAVVEVPVIERDVLGKPTTFTVLLAKGNKNFLSFFNRGVPYKFLGTFTSVIHLFGSRTGGYYPWGGDQFGRDLLSRLMHGSRVSLSVGILGAIISFTIGLVFGGLAGYFGGLTDTIMMRTTEIVYSFPAIYLLFTLRAVFPPSLTSVQVYLLIVLILAFVGWATLARIIRGMVLSIKNEDYVMSARTMGLSNLKIVTKHILPNTMSFVIIQATITIPGYILGESALSLLGLGITEPQSSWGLMLSVARNYRVVKDFPWILIPGFAIFLAIMAWNFFGDGVRDAVDPRSRH